MSKAKVLSISTLYMQVELLEPTALQHGQTVEISPADAPPAQQQPEPATFKASVTTQNQAPQPSQDENLSANSSLSSSQDSSQNENNAVSK